MEESEKPEKLKRCLQKDTAGPVPARALECCLDAERNGKHRGVTLGNTFRRVGRNVLKWLPTWLATILLTQLLSSCVRLTFLSRVRRSSICILGIWAHGARWSAWDSYEIFDAQKSLAFWSSNIEKWRAAQRLENLLQQIEIMTRAECSECSASSDWIPGVFVTMTKKKQVPQAKLRGNHESIYAWKMGGFVPSDCDL